jgi:hypothetical protein
MINAETSSNSQPTCNAATAVAVAVASETLNMLGSATKIKFNSATDLSVVAGTPVSPTLIVQFQDNAGSITTGSIAPVTLSIFSGPTGGTIIGTPRVSAIAGVVTFSNIAFNLVGNYVLMASSSGLSPILSPNIQVTASIAAGLKFIVQPAGAVVGMDVIQQPQVAVIDAYQNNINQNIIITFTAFIDATAVPMTGITTVATVNGIGTPALRFGSTGTGVKLTASSTGLVNGVSQTFNVVQASGYAIRLLFASSPTSATTDVVFPTAPTVNVVDAAGSVVTNSNVQVTLSIYKAGGILVSSSIVSAVQGVAVFPGLSISLSGLGYYLTATATGLTTSTSATFTVNGAASLAFSSTLTGIQPNQGFNAQLVVYDFAGALYTADNGFVTISIKPFTGSPAGRISAQALRVQIINGVVRFNDVKISASGTGNSIYRPDRIYVLIYF